LPVRDIRVVGVATREKEHLIQLLPQKAGQPLDRELVRQSLKVLFDSGLFADVQVLAEKTPDNQVVLTFTTVNNYFIGSIAAEGDPGRSVPRSCSWAKSTPPKNSSVPTKTSCR
jgi:outer membrane protein assembly factor BamA